MRSLFFYADTRCTPAQIQEHARKQIAKHCPDSKQWDVFGHPENEWDPVLCEIKVFDAKENS